MSIEGAKDASRYFISRLAGQIEGYHLKRYPGDHPGTKQWLRLMSGVLDTATEYLEASETVGLAPQVVKDLVQDAGDLAMMAYNFLGMASGTDLEELPYSVVLPLQRWFRAPGLVNSTIFRAELVANYEIATIPDSIFTRIRDPSQSLVEAIRDVQWPLKRITVPSRALGMLQHFAVVAHEIGHAIFPLVTWNFKAQSQEFDNTRARIAGRIATGAISADLNIFFNQVFLDWIEEIASDAFGHLMAGPAFFFALGGFLQTAGGSLGIGEGYPANETRLSIIYKHLRGSPGASFTDTFQNHTGVVFSHDINSALLPKLPSKNDLIRQLETRLEASPSVSSNEKAVVIAEMTSLIEAIADQVYAQAKAYLTAHCPEMIYGVDKFDADIQNHLGSLIQAIPPIESGRLLSDRQPTEFATIINIGWIVYLVKIDDLAVRVSSSGGRSEKADKLHSLLLKAVELSEARRAWRDAV